MQHFGIYSSAFSTLAAGRAANVSNVTFIIKTFGFFYLQLNQNCITSTRK